MTQREAQDAAVWRAIETLVLPMIVGTKEEVDAGLDALRRIRAALTPQSETKLGRDPDRLRAALVEALWPEFREPRPGNDDTRTARQKAEEYASRIEPRLRAALATADTAVPLPGAACGCFDLPDDSGYTMCSWHEVRSRWQAALTPQSEGLERCAKCGSTDLYRDYHAPTTCAEHCNACHKHGCRDLRGKGRAEHFYRSCRGCHFAWMEDAAVAPPLIEGSGRVNDWRLRKALEGLRGAVIVAKGEIPRRARPRLPAAFFHALGDVNIWLDKADAALALTPQSEGRDVELDVDALLTDIDAALDYVTGSTGGANRRMPSQMRTAEGLHRVRAALYGDSSTLERPTTATEQEVASGPTDESDAALWAGAVDPRAFWPVSHEEGE